GGGTQYIMETGYNERQGISPVTGRVMRFEPRPGYFQTDPQINTHRSPAMSDDPGTWPLFWPDRLGDQGDPGWSGSWDGYFGMGVDPSMCGSSLSCDGIYESDDDNAFWDLCGVSNLVYAWDRYDHGVDLSGPCGAAGYLGYSFLQTPGNPLDGIDNDRDGITDERQDRGEGTLVAGQSAILDHLAAHYDTTKFTAYYGRLVDRAAFAAGAWWTGDEDMDWDAASDDRGADGEWGTHAARQ